MKRILLVFMAAAVFSSVLPALGTTVIVNDRDGAKRYSGGEYADASLYSYGPFTYDGSVIDTVNADWQKGSIEIIQKDGEMFSVSESGTVLSEEESLHYLIKDGTLFIKFCESGYDYTGKTGDKNLRLEIPAGINLSVSSVSSSLTAYSLCVKELSVSSVSGTVEAGTVDSVGDVYLSTVSGDFSFTFIDSESIAFSSTSGSISVGEADAERVSFSTLSGTVTLKKAEFDYGKISTSSGSKYLSDVECEEMSLASVSGRTEGNDIGVRGKLTVTGTSGDCSFLNLGVTELSAKLSSGDFRARNIRVNKVNLSTSSGKVELSLMSDVEGEIVSVSGSVSLSGVQDDTSVLFASVSGNLSTGKAVRRKDGGPAVVGEGKHELSVRTTGGSLGVD